MSGWGRKAKLINPSAGVYTYSYKDFSDITGETTPKGSTTYTYNAVGKLTNKRIQGDHTDMQMQYTYDGVTKLLTSLSMTNADGNDETYTYTYDNYQRVIQSMESNVQTRFTRNYTYDSFGRPLTEEYVAQSLTTGKTASKKIRNTYQYGGLKSILDDVSGTAIWTVTAVNARGPLTSRDGKVYGQITVTYKGKNQFYIAKDTYNFEHHSTGSWFRNTATVLGAWWAGSGKAYDIYFRGLNIVTYMGHNYINK